MGIESTATNNIVQGIEGKLNIGSMIHQKNRERALAYIISHIKIIRQFQKNNILCVPKNINCCIMIKHRVLICGMR